MLSENIMKKNDLDDDMRPEYDLSTLKNEVTGKYVDRYREGTNVVLLEPEVYQAFPDSESVNAALKLLIEVAHREVRN